MGKLKVLDLFSGIGGFSLGLESTGYFETVGFCEIDPFCQKILKKHWPHVPIINDIKEFHTNEKIDVITGGYPCQPFSQAGKRKGAEDDRHLWPFMFEIIKQQRPCFVIAENVIGHITVGLDDVLFNLESEGYTARPVVIPACAVDAKHRRDRVWIIATLADSNSERVQGGEKAGDIKSQRPQSEEHSLRCSSARDWHPWPAEPGVDRVANGIPNRVDRIRSLGNSIVPQIAAKIGEAIYSLHSNN